MKWRLGKVKVKVILINLTYWNNMKLQKKKNSRIHVAREKVSRQNHYKYKGCRGLKIQLPKGQIIAIIFLIKYVPQWSSL